MNALRYAWLGVLLCGCAGQPPTAAPLPGADALHALAWLAGTHRTSGTPLVEEVWSAPGGSTMFGVGRTIDGDTLVGFEFLRIEARAEAIVYVAHPGGRMPGTEFTLLPQTTPDTFVFSNPDHDFPQRVIYRQIDTAHTQARAENDDQALIFDFTRAQ